MTESLLRIRARIVRLDGETQSSSGAMVVFLSRIGLGGRRVIVRLKGVVPVEAYTWLL